MAQLTVIPAGCILSRLETTRGGPLLLSAKVEANTLYCKEQVLFTSVAQLGSTEQFNGKSHRCRLSPLASAGAMGWSSSFEKQGYQGAWDPQLVAEKSEGFQGGSGSRADEEGLDGEETDEKSGFDATLDMLEWPRLCEIVSTFASTSMGKKMARKLVFPPSRDQSEVLLAETKAALGIESMLGGTLDFGGINTGSVMEGLGMMRKGIPIGGPQAAATASLLTAANGLRRSILGAVADGTDEEKADLLPLAEMVKPMVTHPEVVRSIWEVVEEDGTVKDGASPDLRRARVQQRTVQMRLQELLNRLTKERPDGSAGGQVATLGGRLCVVVPAEGRTAVPGLLLQSTAGGASLYVEPAAAVPLNNKLAEANQEAARAEQAVLTALSGKLRDHLDDVKFVLDVVVGLDVIVSRARFGSWIGANPPSFMDVEDLPPMPSRGAQSRRLPTPRSKGLVSSREEGGGGTEGRKGPLVDLKKLRHPLLLLQYRESLRKAKLKATGKAKAVSRLRRRYGAWTSGAMEEAEREAREAAAEVRRLSRGQPSYSHGRVPRSPTIHPRTHSKLETRSADSCAHCQVAALEASVPVAIDVQIQRSTRVVTITGPNTGGKTATIKTVGLAALMAKAGLYVLAADAQLPWVDAVLADIGDQQSLTQSLSTFSGHLARIQRIKHEATASSLVLLDEVGAGTDPLEGAALGMALLESFAQRALLTLATTHHGELKTLKYRDARFENASVEFDEVRLVPTYRLLWGIPGRSNALNIAERLGLPAGIVAEARSMQGSATAEVNEVIMEMEQAKRAYEDDVAAMEVLVSESEKMHSELTAAARRLESHRAKLTAARADIIAAAADEARAKVLRITRDARARERVSRTPQVVPAGIPARPTSAPATPCVEAESAESTSRQTNGHDGSQSEAAVPSGEPPGGRPSDDDAREIQQSRDSRGGASEGPSPEVDLNWVPTEGEFVMVPKLGARAKVTGVNAAKRTVSVMCGFMQVAVKLSEVRRLEGGQEGPILQRASSGATGLWTMNSGATSIEGKAREKKSSKASRDRNKERSYVRSDANTVDVRGLFVEEAQEVLDEEMGLLLEGGEQAMFVVHGIGTGKLRAAIEVFLMEDPRVQRVERASPKDGGEGTTIAFFT